MNLPLLKFISCDQAFSQSKGAMTRSVAASLLSIKTLPSKGFRP